MPVEKIGINFSNFNNVTAPNYNLSGDPKVLINDLIVKTNELTNNTFGFGILFFITIMLYWILNDRSPFGEYGYSSIRSLTLSLGVVSILGLVFIQANIIYSWQSVAFFIVLMLVSSILITFVEQKQ